MSGAGGLGLMCLSLLKKMGGKGAIVVDIDPVKLRGGNGKLVRIEAIDGAAPEAAKQIIEATGGGAVGGDRSDRQFAAPRNWGSTPPARVAS